jgi:hypothetical protein
VIGQKARCGYIMAVNRSLCGREGSCRATKVSRLGKQICLHLSSALEPQFPVEPVEYALLCSVTDDYLHLAHGGITWLTRSRQLIGVVF